MYLKIFKICVLKSMSLILQNFYSAPGFGWQVVLKMIKVKLDIFTDIDMLLMVRKGIRGGICHSIYWYAKADNKYMKDYEKKKELLHVQYWDVNNIYGQTMSQKFPVNSFEWIKNTSQFNEDLIKNYNEESE